MMLKISETFPRIIKYGEHFIKLSVVGAKNIKSNPTARDSTKFKHSGWKFDFVSRS
jgi:hypothetical protein